MVRHQSLNQHSYNFNSFEQHWITEWGLMALISGMYDLTIKGQQ